MPSSPGPVGADIFSASKKPNNGNKLANSIRLMLFTFIMVVLFATAVVMWKLDGNRRARHKDRANLAHHSSASHVQGAASCWLL
jgi:heme/copper-type cytochrome/quinol oxidase subunit 2